MISNSILWAKIIFGLIASIILLLILQNFIFFISRNELFSPIVMVLEWILFLSLIFFLFFHVKGYSFLKVFLILIFFKILFYALILGDFNFAKGILVVPLIMIFTFENEEFRVLSKENIIKYHWILFLLILLTVIPFIGWYNRYDKIIAQVGIFNSHRFAGLWELPHDLAYYLLALIILKSKQKIISFVVLFLLIIATGVRSVFIALFVYFVYDNFIIKIAFKSYRKIIVFLITFLFLAIVSPLQNYVISQIDFHLGPLFQQNIENLNYGKGRVLFAYYDLEQIRNFNFIELLVGKSATQLYEDYKKLLGVESWPHDDFLTVPFIYGIIGLSFYIYYLIIYPIRKVNFNFKSKLIPIIFSIVILAITNGFYTYHAMYLFIMAIGMYYQDEIKLQLKNDE